MTDSAMPSVSWQLVIWTSAILPPATVVVTSTRSCLPWAVATYVPSLTAPSAAPDASADEAGAASATPAEDRAPSTAAVPATAADPFTN